MSERDIQRNPALMSFYDGWLPVSFSGSSLTLNSQQKTRDRCYFLLSVKTLLFWLFCEDDYGLNDRRKLAAEK